MTQGAGPILQSNFIGKPHLVAIPQTPLQVSRTRWLQDNSSITSSGHSGPPELRGRFGSTNPDIDSPHKESSHRPNVEDIDFSVPAQLSGGTSAPPWSTSCILCSSSSSPLGPPLVTKTASHNLHTSWDISSHEPRPELGRGRSQVSPFATKTGGKLTHDKQSYSKPTTVPERVPLYLDHTVSAADPPSFNSHIQWKGTILAPQLMRTLTTTLSKPPTKYLLRGGQQEQRKLKSTKTFFMIRPGCDASELNQILKVTKLRSSYLILGLPHQMMLLVDERSLTAYKEIIPARCMLMKSPNHEIAKNVI